MVEVQKSKVRVKSNRFEADWNLMIRNVQPEIYKEGNGVNKRVNG